MERLHVVGVLSVGEILAAYEATSCAKGKRWRLRNRTARDRFLNGASVAWDMPLLILSPFDASF